MPYATNPDDGFRIYYEMEGSGTSLFLHTQMTGALRNWRDSGYVDALRDRFTLIMHDPRGHGASNKPTDPELCRIECFADDVVAVLDELGIERTHYFGYSMGARAGWFLAHGNASRIASMIAGGGPIHPPAASFEPLMDAFEEGPQTYISVLEELLGHPLPVAMKEQLIETDTRPLGVVARGKELDSSAEPFLSSITIPILVYAGSRDLIFPENPGNLPISCQTRRSSTYPILVTSRLCTKATSLCLTSRYFLNASKPKGTNPCPTQPTPTTASGSTMRWREMARRW